MQRERTRDAWKNIADEAHDYFCDQLASFSTSSTTAWKQVEVPSAENSVVAVFKTRGLNNNSNINPAREGSLRSQLPVYMGSGRIDGVHPEQVLALIRKSKSCKVFKHIKPYSLSF